MKTIRIITLVLIALLLLVGMLLSEGGQRQGIGTPESVAVQAVSELDLVLPEWEPLLLEGDDFFQLSRVAWNS